MLPGQPPQTAAGADRPSPSPEQHPPSTGGSYKIAIALDPSDESAHAVRWAVQNYLRRILRRSPIHCWSHGAGARGRASCCRDLKRREILGSSPITSACECDELEATVTASASASASRDLRGRTRRISPAEMPSAEEIEEFFAAAEKAKKQRFAEKYNFDVEKEVPLEGRYEWVRLK